MESDIRLRPVTGGDLGFVTKTWLRSMADDRGRVRACDVARMLDIVAGNSGALTVLCLSDSPAYVLGWVAREGDTVRWVYVRDTYRGRGFGKMLKENR